MNNPLEDYITSEQKPQLLNDLIGIHRVKVARVLIIDDVTAIDGEPRANLQDHRDWNDVNPVMYAYLTGEGGVHHARFYWYGYFKYKELLRNPKYASRIDEFRLPSSSDMTSYAINKATGNREINEEASAYCRKLIDQFATACGKPGQKLQELVGCELFVEVREKIIGSKRVLKIVQMSDVDHPLIAEEERVTIKVPKIPGTETGISIW